MPLRFEPIPPDKVRSSPTETEFAPAGRAKVESLTADAQLVARSPLFQALIDAVDGYLAILNPQRQILAVNRNLSEALGDNPAAAISGLRLGEAVGCTHATEGPDGCGSSSHCSACGQLGATLASQKAARPVTEECLLTVNRGGKTQSMEFRVRATPIALGEIRLTVLVLNDISGEKRRAALERVFFHDILNTIGGLIGWSRRLRALGNAEPGLAPQRIVDLAAEVAREVEAQRMLMEAEDGRLELRPEEVRIQDLQARLRNIFEHHPSADKKTLEIVPVEVSATLLTDGALLMRVLTNMLKNALEAVAPGQTVRLSAELAGDRCTFRVWNPGVIRQPVALRIFQRFFSTKRESGRGLGTHAMRLLGEHYLGGRVGFDSTEEAGTTFWLRLPREGPAASPPAPDRSDRAIEV